jgi:hypothetical protein
MSGILKIDITESEATLKTLVQQQSSARHQERLQALYWLKSGQVSTRLELSSLLGRGESTLYRWLQRWPRDALWLYGAVEPLTGQSFFYRFSHLDAVCFELFLQEFGAAFGDTMNLLQMDQAGAHVAAQI